jgi:hypothetical protein
MNKEETMKELSKKIAEGWAYHDYMMLDSTTLLKETVSDPIERIRKSYGTPLSSELRKKFEPIMGFKMGDVKIHTDKTSQDTANNLNAEAFTYGKDIYFAQDKYNPETTGGKALIGHELTHIAQQKGKAGELAMKGFSSTQDLEKQAENMEKYLTEVFARSKSNEPLIKIDNIEIKAQDKEQEDNIRFLRIKTMLESLIEPYIYKELANNPELAQYLMTHDVEIDSVEGMSDLNLDNDIQVEPLVKKIVNKVNKIIEKRSLIFNENLTFSKKDLYLKKDVNEFFAINKMERRAQIYYDRGLRFYRKALQRRYFQSQNIDKKIEFMRKSLLYFMVAEKYDSKSNYIKNAINRNKLELQNLLIKLKKNRFKDSGRREIILREDDRLPTRFILNEERKRQHLKQGEQIIEVNEQKRLRKLKIKHEKLFMEFSVNNVAKAIVSVSLDQVDNLFEAIEKLRKVEEVFIDSKIKLDDKNFSWEALSKFSKILRQKQFLYKEIEKDMERRNIKKLKRIFQKLQDSGIDIKDIHFVKPPEDRPSIGRWVEG